MPNNAIGWLWWVFTAIILAIIVNVGSHYLIPHVDNIWERLSSARMIKNDKKRQELEKIVAQMLADTGRVVLTSTLILLVSGLFWSSITLTVIPVFLIIATGIADSDAIFLLSTSIVFGLVAVVSLRILIALVRVMAKYSERRRELLEIQTPVDTDNQSDTQPALEDQKGVTK